MSERPPEAQDPGDIDAEYRRASALDDSRPSERVREAVLAHAAQLARERMPPTPRAARRARSQHPLRWLADWRAPLAASVAAAALAAILITPHYLVLGPSKPTPDELARHAPREQQAAPSSTHPPESLEPAAPAAAQAPPAPSPAVTAPSAVPTAPPAPTPQESAPAANAESAETPGGLQAPAMPASRVAGGAAPAAVAPFAAPRARVAAPPASDPSAQLRQAAESGDLKGLEAAVAAHADLESRDAGGRTALLLATLNDQAAAVDFLLSRGADPNAVDAAGLRPLAAARARREDAVAEALRRAGAD